MARTVTVTSGIARTLDSLYDTNAGGSTVNIGFRGTPTDTNQNPIYGILRFYTESIIGGYVTGVKVKVNLKIKRLDSSISNDDSPYIKAYLALPGRTDDITEWKMSDIAGLVKETSIGDSATKSYSWAVNQYVEIPLNSDLNYAAEFGVILFAFAKAFPTGTMDFSAHFNSFEAESNLPLMELTLNEADINVINANPISGFVDKTAPVQFVWGIEPNYSGGPFIGTILPQGAKFRWRMAGDLNYKEVSVTGASYIVPANTFGNGDVQWQVEVTSNAGTTATSDWFTVSTIDTDAIAAPISPDGVKINREDETLFTWTHTTANGTVQTAADLQYSTNVVTWYDLASVEGSELSVTVPGDTLPIGTVYWRIRTYNANGVAGEWSDAAAVTVVGKVPPPVIAAVTPATAAPEIRWSAQLQQAYEAQIVSGSDVVYQSGTKLGTEKTHKVKALMPDGTYTAKVRVYAENGEVSDWAEYSFTISTEKPTVPTILAQPVAGGVKLTVSADTTAYILRDGVPIGIARAGEYIDYGGAGQSVYVVRAVTSQETYSDSQPVTAGPLLQGSVIAPADNLAAMIKLYLNLNDNPKREMTWSPVGSMSHYAGRKYPMYEYTEQEDESYNYSFAFREAKEYQAFMELVKKRGAMLYRDQYGVRYYGVITGVSPGFNWGGYAVSFSVTRVDHKEGIEYDI